MRVRGPFIAAIAAGAFAAAPGPAGAAILPPTLGPGGCDDPTQGNADFEAYGPTDVNVQAGNGRVTVNENAAGTITVFKYPDPSLFNLVKYFTLSRGANGKVQVQYPNEGSFAGIRYRTRKGGSKFAWLRDWRSRQRYDSPDTPVPVTTYRSPKRLGLRVTDSDLAPPHTGRFAREFWVKRAARSPVRSASLVYFENFNPVASHIPLLPIGDWCISQTTDQSASYDAGQHAIVNSWSGVDQATGKPASIAVAFGFARRDSAHQVGGDAYEQAALPGQPPDAYDQAPQGLGGADSATGQTTGALEQKLRFDRHGRAEARMTITGGGDSAAALKALRRGRRVPFARQMASERRDWHRFLSHRTLPAANARRVTDVAKRSLITLRLARAAKTGAIVASVNTQGPYGEDWIRDGAFINRLLDNEGLHRWVTKHNRFYARVQASAQNPSAIRPPGNWAMNSYSDGVDGRRSLGDRRDRPRRLDALRPLPLPPRRRRREQVPRGGLSRDRPRRRLPHRVPGPDDRAPVHRQRGRQPHAQPEPSRRGAGRAGAALGDRRGQGQRRHLRERRPVEAAPGAASRRDRRSL